MKGRLAWALVLGIALVAMWRGTLWVIERVVLEKKTDAEVFNNHRVTALEELVMETLVPAALSNAVLQEETETSEQDDLGTWKSHYMSWKLPEGEDPDRMALRLRQLAQEMAPDSHVYVTTEDELDVDLRIYVGKRLTHHLHLEPTLSADLPPQGEEPALVALVVTGFGANGPLGQRILALPQPLTTGMVAFEPFTLRQSRQAAVSRKEILLQLPEGMHDAASVMEALQAVPHASGILVEELPDSLPVAELLDGNLYLLDGTEEIEGSVLRAANNAGIPVIRATEVLEGEVEEDLLRLGHLSRSQSEIVLLVDLEDPALGTVLTWLEEAEPGALRPSFLTEVVEQQ